MRNLSIFLAFVLTVSLATGCSKQPSAPSLLDPKNPTTITLWHYYNGTAKTAFDELTNEFNQTVGAQQGIIVDAYSQGDVNDLAEAVFHSATKDIGSAPMPNIFASYSDNALRIDEQVGIANLDAYFTPEELAEYRAEFVEDGRFTKAAPLKIIPVAKSTENLFINLTDFEVFAAATGASLDTLQTWEGLCATAALYYSWTDAQTPEPNDGKALFGMDAMANFILLSCAQQGVELYGTDASNTRLNFPKEAAKNIWDAFYVPFVKGHYAAIGRFRSDDAKTGDLLAYIGSTAGAGYFPKQIELSKSSSRPIVCAVLPYPTFAQGKPLAVQQGAGMAVAKSDEAHEYACAVFLKWFTSASQNLKFAVSTGYLPVKNAALNKDLILSQLAAAPDAQSSESIVASINATIDMLDSYTLYNYKPFSGSVEVRKILEASLLTIAKEDRSRMQKLLAEGQTPEQAFEALDTDAQFESWYNTLLADATAILQNN